MTPVWAKALGLTVLGLSAVGLALLAMGDEPSSSNDGIPVTENPPDEDEITDTDDEDDEES